MTNDIVTTQPPHFVLSPLDGEAEREPSENRVKGLRLLTIAGVSIISLFFGALIGWGYFAELASAAIAPGVVKVASNRKTIQHLEGGIVERILVRDGDRVVAGQLLVQLGGAKSSGKLELLRGQRLAALALISRLTAERDTLDRIEFPPALSSLRGDRKIDNLMRIQRDIFAARRKSVSTRAKIISQRTIQFEKEIEGLEAQISANDTQLRLVGEELRGVKILFDKKLIPVSRLLKLQRDAAKIEGERGRGQSQIARVNQQIAEARLEILDLHERSGKEAVQELDRATTQLNEAVERIPALEDILQRLKIRAPIDGTIVQMEVHTVGGVIGAGDPLMHIVPKDDTLVIEAKINPNDIDVVHPGLMATVRLSALNRKSSTPFKARVQWVSADRLTDESTGLSYFLARLEIADDLEIIQRDAPLYPGMAAEVMIMTGQDSVLDLVARPFKRNLARAFRDG